jgi:hypothetical protein
MIAVGTKDHTMIDALLRSRCYIGLVVVHKDRCLRCRPQTLQRQPIDRRIGLGQSYGCRKHHHVEQPLQIVALNQPLGLADRGVAEQSRSMSAAQPPDQVHHIWIDLDIAKQRSLKVTNANLGPLWLGVKAQARSDSLPVLMLIDGAYFGQSPLGRAPQDFGKAPCLQSQLSLQNLEQFRAEEGRYHAAKVKDNRLDLHPRPPPQFSMHAQPTKPTFRVGAKRAVRSTMVMQS